MEMVDNTPASDGKEGLIVLHDNPHAKIDIIAVHGLGANPAWAWRHKVKNLKGKETGQIVNWLKDDDMLPSRVPDARILAFNYESAWLSNADKTRIWSLGELLMDSILCERQSDNIDQQRPVIFLGHSFGGILIEQALVNANQGNSKFEPIAKCTTGVVFFGTPHQGSSPAAVGTMLAKVFEVFQQGSNDAIMKELREGSENLRDLVHNFMNWAIQSSVNIKCYHETKVTNYGARYKVRANYMVVDEYSGCLPGYSKTQLSTDHIKIVKYAGKDDPSYKLVAPTIADMVAKASEQVRLRFNPRIMVQDNSLIPPAFLDCQKALFVKDPNGELLRIGRRLGKRTPNTCTWIETRSEYQEWLLTRPPQVLRLVGEPGMGKSMIFTYLVGQITKKLSVTNDMVLAYHFCDNKDSATNTAVAVIRDLLFQMFQQRPQHYALLDERFKAQGNKLFDDFYAMLSVFNELLEKYGARELVLMIDAVDECDEQSQNDLVNLLNDVAAHPTLNVRVFLTCRPELTITQGFEGEKIELKMKIGDISDDLQRYMKERVPRLIKKKGWGDVELDMISKDLMEKADNTRITKHDIPKTLKELPLGLEKMYKRMTDAYGESAARCKMILEVVAGARRPLQMEELSMGYVLALHSPDPWEHDVLPSKEHLDGMDDTYLQCGRLLQVDQTLHTVNLVHQSAKDYLLKIYLYSAELGEKIFEEDKSKTKERPKKTNVKLNNLFLEIIYRYFSLKSFNHLANRMVFESEWDIDWECSWWEVDPSPAFLVYSGREWEAHAKDAEKNETTGMATFARFICGPEGRKSIRNSWLRRVAVTENPRAKEFAGWLLDVPRADINAPDFRGWTAIQLAAKANRVDMVKFLHERGAYLEFEDVPAYIDGRTPVQTAAEEGHQEMVDTLVELGADINALPTRIHGRTALQAAAEKGSIDMVKHLLREHEAETDVLHAEVSGVTALLAAASSGGEWQMGKNIHRTIKQRSRLPGSAEIDTANINEEDQLDRQERADEEKKHEDVVALLCKVKAKMIPNQFGWTALHAAVERESDDMVARMLKLEGVEEIVAGEKRGDHDGTPLHSARAKANVGMAQRLADKGGKDDWCTYSRLDLDAMMKYIRAVITRLMIRSNTERFFFIQSYIPVYHVVYSYCAEGLELHSDKPMVGPNGRRGELVYRDVDAWVKSYVKHGQAFIFETPKCNDFLTVYLREWKLFKRGAYYIGRMLRYLTRYWVKHEREELQHKETHDISDLFFFRWRTGMTIQMRKKLLDNVRALRKAPTHDDRVLNAIDESLNGPWEHFKSNYEAATEYFEKFNDVKKMKDFEMHLRRLTDEFVVEGDNIEQKRKKLSKLDVWEYHDEAVEYFLTKLEPLFLEQYQGGLWPQIEEHVTELWETLKEYTDEDKRVRKNQRLVAANARNNVTNGEEATNILLKTEVTGTAQAQDQAKEVDPVGET